MGARLRRAVHLLQRKAQEFYDPAFDQWCFETRTYASPDSPKRYKAAYLHAELWRNEATGGERWVLVALREGWRVPEREIEELVWSSTTAGGTTDEIDPEASNHPFEF